MIEISENNYRAVAEKLSEKIGTQNYYNGVVEHRGDDGLEMTLVTTAIIYRKDELLPEGRRRPIRDIVPVWWEMRTPGGVNDFDFGELKQMMING